MQADIATFSIAARDRQSGELGVAVASKFLAVGAYVPYVRRGIGAVATQARTNLGYGPQVLQLLGKGLSPDECSSVVRGADPGAARRQLGVVSASGESHTFTGGLCTAWAGGRAGPDYAVQGNILTGSVVLDAMEDAWLLSDGLPLPVRLLAVLDAGEGAGGDSRGRQAAALLIDSAETRIDLRVDDDLQPIVRLHALYDLWRQQAP